MKKSYSSEIGDIFVALGIILGYLAIMAALVYLTGVYQN